MDTNVRGNLQRVYFFKDISAFEEATSFSYTSLNWIESNPNANTSYQTIFGTMNGNGFIVAFVMAEYSTLASSSNPYAYQFYSRYNGV